MCSWWERRTRREPGKKPLRFRNKQIFVFSRLAANTEIHKCWEVVSLIVTYWEIKLWPRLLVLKCQASESPKSNKSVCECLDISLLINEKGNKEIYRLSKIITTVLFNFIQPPSVPVPVNEKRINAPPSLVMSQFQKCICSWDERICDQNQNLLLSLCQKHSKKNKKKSAVPLKDWRKIKHIKQTCRFHHACFNQINDW